MTKQNGIELEGDTGCWAVIQNGRAIHRTLSLADAREVARCHGINPDAR